MAFQADLFVLFHKWPHPVCLLLFRLQPSHYCVLHNSALVGASPHVSPTSPRHESGDTWICQSCRHSQRTSSADVTHFTLFTITFEPETFFFFFCLRLRQSQLGTLSASHSSSAPGSFEAPVHLSVVRTFSCTPPPTLWSSPSIHTPLNSSR